MVPPDKTNSDILNLNTIKTVFQHNSRWGKIEKNALFLSHLTKRGRKILNSQTYNKVSNEINLIGKTSNEALYELEKFLDQARLLNLTPVRVIHGFGQGILRATVENYLKKCSFVESYSLAGYGQGSGGATMVYLKKRNEK